MDIPLFIAKYHRWGGSFCILIPFKVRQLLELLPGDLIAIRVIGKKAVICKLVPAAVAPISEDEAAIALTYDNRSRGA